MFKSPERSRSLSRDYFNYVNQSQIKEKQTKPNFVWWTIMHSIRNEINLRCEKQLELFWLWGGTKAVDESSQMSGYKKTVWEGTRASTAHICQLYQTSPSIRYPMDFAWLSEGLCNCKLPHWLHPCIHKNPYFGGDRIWVILLSWFFFEIIPVKIQVQLILVTNTVINS